MSVISLDDFKTDIASIREYIKHIDLVNGIAKDNRDSKDKTLTEFCSHLSRFRTYKKIFEYKSIVISLYGILEKHINIWIREHTETIPRLILRYDELPEIIRENNFSFSIRLISLISENRFAKYEDLNKEDILAKLNNCLKQGGLYSLNAEAFMPFSGNLKHSKVIEAFKNLNIDLSKYLKSNKQFVDFYKTKFSKPIDNKGEEAFKQINEIVELRNDISHGSQVDTILNINEFEDYIFFLEKYGIAIFESILEKEIEYEANHIYEEVKDIINVYHKGSVLCFEIENTVISKGDFIIVKTADDHYLKKSILEIQKDNIPYDELEVSSKVSIGVNLGSGITKKQKFYIKIK